MSYLFQGMLCQQKSSISDQHLTLLLSALCTEFPLKHTQTRKDAKSTKISVTKNITKVMCCSALRLCMQQTVLYLFVRLQRLTSKGDSQVFSCEGTFKNQEQNRAQLEQRRMREVKYELECPALNVFCHMH